MDRTRKTLHLFELLPELRPRVETAWRAHSADDFRRLASVPSTPVVTACTAFLADRATYDLDFLMCLAEGTLPEDAARALWKITQEIQRGQIWLNGYSMAKTELRLWLRHARSPEEHAHVESQLKQLAGIDTPKASEIRRALKPLLASEFGTKLASEAGGVWTALLNGTAGPFELELDFGGFERGLRWALRVPARYPHNYPVCVSYEDALGFRSSGWNLLRTDWLEPQLRSLVGHVREVAGWLEQVDWDAARERADAANEALRRALAKGA
jgi:hypothetical protein